MMLVRLLPLAVLLLLLALIFPGAAVMLYALAEHYWWVWLPLLIGCVVLSLSGSIVPRPDDPASRR